MEFRQTQATVKQVMKGDRSMFSSSVDNATVKQIMETHAAEAHEIDAKTLLRIVEDIFTHASAAPKPAYLEDKTNQTTDFAMPEALLYVIDRVAGKIAWRSSVGGDVHEATMAVLSMLSNYSWDGKLVLALAAFAIKYGGIKVVAQSYASNQLAKSVAILKQLSGISEDSGMLKARLDETRSFIKTMLDIAMCIIEIKELPSQPARTDSGAQSIDVSVAVYWTTRGIIACASQISGLTGGLGHEYMASPAKVWEFSSLEHKLSNIRSQLRVQVTDYYRHNIDDKKVSESYQNLLQLFEMDHTDNMKVLKALIYAKDDMQTLVDGTSKKRVNIDVLLRKNVLLLISDFDILKEELSMVEKVYNKLKKHPTMQESQCEVLWLPVPDYSSPWTESMQKQFQNLQSSMTWYTVYQPTLIDRATVRFIREVWHFRKKPVVVVLDPAGKVVCPNAYHMMCIWGSAAFPFTTLREEALWKAESWRLELLVDAIDPVILNWISRGRYICMYGGEDMEWIRRFTGRARAVAHAAGITLGMVYVGRSNPKERIRRTISTIIIENLSHCWLDVTSVWYFWARIESMWHSKNQLGRTTGENDPILKGIMTVLSFDGSADGWALHSRGSQDMAIAKGTTFLNCLLDYTIWRGDALKKGFLQALKDHLKKLQTPHQCNRFKLPTTTGMIPERLACSECGRSMDRFILYECSDE